MRKHQSVHCGHPPRAFLAALEHGWTLPHCGRPYCHTCVGRYPPPLAARNALTGESLPVDRWRTR